MPQAYSLVQGIATALSLTAALTTHSLATPFSTLGDEQLQAIHDIAKIFATSIATPTDPASTLAPSMLSQPPSTLPVLAPPTHLTLPTTPLSPTVNPAAPSPRVSAAAQTPCPVFVTPSLRVGAIYPTPFQPQRNLTLPNLIDPDDN